MTVAAKIFSLGCAALGVAVTPTLARAQSDQAGLKAFAVHINRTPQQPWPGYGVYLGNGLVSTAAHVAGGVTSAKPHVVIAGQDLPAALIKQGNLESVDLTLLSIDGTKLPIGLQMRRTPLCERPPFAGERVVVAIPEGTAVSKVLPRGGDSGRFAGERFDTNIADVATAGNFWLGCVCRRRRSVPAGHHKPQDFGLPTPIEAWRPGPHGGHRQVFRPGRRDQSRSYRRTPRFRARHARPTPTGKWNRPRSNLVDDAPHRLK